MVKVTDMQLNPTDKTVLVSLFADSKSEITDDVVVDGIPVGYSIGLGSDVMTVDGELAFRKSDGTWNWM